MASRLNPYLGFRDDAREAMDSYQAVFGGELARSTFVELGASEDPAEKDRIMRAMLTTPSGFTLMAADTPAGMTHDPGDAYSVSPSGDAASADELRGYGDRLSEGGQVRVPLEKAPWGDTFGLCTDRFGVPWMVNIASS